jgi:hypothetical protein
MIYHPFRLVNVGYLPNTIVSLIWQVVVLDAIADISLTGPGVPSLILRYLSEFSTLPFLTAFHAPILSPALGTPIAAPSQKQNTYIALSKKVMSLIVELYMRFKDELEIYEDGTLEAVFSVCIVR